MPLFAPSRVSPKTVLTVCLVTAGTAAVLYALWRAPLALGITLLSAVLAVALEHIVSLLSRLRIPRGVGIALVMLGLLGALVGIGFLLIPPAITQGRQLVHSSGAYLQTLPSKPLVRKLSTVVDVPELVAAAERYIRQQPAELAQQALSVLGSAVRAVGSLVTVLFVTLFMLVFGRRLVHAVLDQAIPEHRKSYRRILDGLYRTLGGYLLGVGCICISNATASSLFLVAIGVPYFLPLGVASGLASLIPIVGATLAGTMLSLVAYASGGTWQGIATAVFYVVYQQLENHLLAPLVYERTLKLDPLLSILSVLFLAELAGIAGAVIAVPLLAAVQVIFRDLLVLRRVQLGLVDAA